MGLLKLFGINKVENILENECYNILDTWMNVEASVNKGLTKPKEAAGVLNAVCDDARAKLEEAKLKDLEAYNKSYLTCCFVIKFLYETSNINTLRSQN